MMETVTLNFMFDPSRLPEGIDPTTSEGKATIKATMIQAMLDAHNGALPLKPTDVSIIEAITGVGE
jgi:hypothetical protein